MGKFLDEDKMAITINKLDMYQRDETINFDAFRQLLNDFSHYYQTDNTKLLESKVFEITSKFNTTIKLHNNDTFVLNRNLENYKNTKIVVENIFNDIN